MNKLTKILTLTLTLLIATVANAALIAYEPFDYAPTNGLNELNGGTGWDSMGWYGAADGSHAIVSPGKTYSNGDALYTIGNMGVANVSCNWSRASRDFATPLNSDEGTTNWFSFLASIEAVTNQYRQYLIGFQSETSVDNVRFMTAGYYENGQWYLNEGGGANYLSGHPSISNETIFVVIEKANGATEDTWTAWINPSVNQSPVYSNSFGGNYAHSTVKGVHFWKGGPPATRYFEGRVDEFRIGETWNDVNTDEPIQVHTPVNETPTNYQNGVSLTPTLTASAFVSNDGADSHSASLFHVESIDGIIVLNTNVGGVTSFNIPAGLLEENTRYFWTVSYKGSHSTKWSTASDLTYFDTTYTVEAQQFAYEGVAYDETTNGIAGYNGGEGWRDSWNPLESYNFWISQQDVVTPGLSYRLLEVTNNTFIARNQIGIWGEHSVMTTNGSSIAVRKLKRDGFASLLNQNNHFGGPNMTTWISGIIEAPVDAVVASNTYRIELRNSIGNTITYIGKPSAKESWGIEWSESDADVVPGEPTFLVAKIVYTTTNSTISLWVNPILGSEPSSNTVADTFLVNDSDYYYDSVAMFVKRSEGCLLPEVKFDELRVGIDWKQVMPGAKSVVPDTPSNIAPANATANVPLDAALDLEGSAFSSESGDTLSKSEFHIESMGGVVIVITGTTETATLPAGSLQEDSLYTLKIRYFSTLSGLPSEYSAGTTFSTVWSPSDTPIAYDGADYTAGDNVDGLNGGYGWASAWNVTEYQNTNLPMNIEVVTPGMTFDTLPVNGNAFYVNESAQVTNRTYILANRKLKTGDGVYHLMANDEKFGKPGTTNWLSFLAKIDDDCTNQTFDLGIGNGWPNIRVEGYYLPETDFVTWKLGGMAGAAATTNSVKTNETAFLVARFISGSESETNGTGYLWINPVLGDTPPAIEDAVSSKTNITYLAFNDLLAVVDVYNSLISVVTNIPEPGVTNITKVYEAPAKVEYDEIRFGDTWQGVTAVPEPCLVFLALGMILAALGLRK